MRRLGSIAMAVLWGALFVSVLVLAGVIVWVTRGSSLEEKAERYFEAAAPAGSVEVIDCVTVEHESESIDDDQWCEVVANARVERLYPGAIPIAKGRGRYCFLDLDDEAFPVRRADRPAGCVL